MSARASYDSTTNGRAANPARASTDSNMSTTRSRTNSIRAPVLPPNESGMSPLAKAGVKGDSLMMFVTCFASLGVFLFGYDQGVMSGIITGPYFKSYFHDPTAYEIGTMVAILEIGALITSLACGTLADVFGRKKVLLFGALVFTIGGTLQTFTTGYSSMVVGRIVSGFGVGALSMIVPTYQAEISPAENRGKLACIEFTGNVVGYASSVWIDYFSSFIQSDASWRLPLAVQAVIGLTLAIGSVMLPESPRWLLDKDRDEEGMRVLADLHGGGDPRAPRARLEFREIKDNVLHMRSEGDRGYKTMMRKYWRRTLIACSSQMFAQLNGINVISYYAPMVFESAGWIGRDAILMTGINGIIYVFATVPTWYLVDRAGRRPILMIGAVICSVSLAACGYFIKIDTPMTPRAVVVGVVIFNASFGFSWGPLPWLYPPEIMPLAFRAKGTSLSTATNWLFNYIVGEMTPILQESIGWRLYVMHASFCLCSLVTVFFFYPETMGVPLEEMDELFGEKSGPIPQHDDEEDEENQPLNRAARESEGDDSADGSAGRRPLRRSISSHPRFMSEEERTAREAAIKVAQEERRKNSRSWFGGGGTRGSRPSLSGLFGGSLRATAASDSEYTPIRGNEH